MAKVRVKRFGALASASLVALGAFVGVIPVAGIGTSIASADPPAIELTTKTVSADTATAGDTLTYFINYTCPGAGGVDCTDAQFSDPLPEYTDVHGNEVPVEFVSASGPSPPWSDFTLDASDPDNPTVVGSGTIPAGQSGTIVITVRIPPNSVPEYPQSLDNTASVTDAT